MKKITVLIATIFPALAMAQSVSINTDASAPHNSAMLDIKSDSKGFLMPRLTTIQRTSIPGPATGLTVFDIDTYSYWMYRGDINGGWVELMNSIDKHWNKTGTHVFNINTGNIGIGTNNPTQKLAINATDPAIDFMNAGSSKGYLQANGNNMRLATYANNTTGNIVFNTKAVDRMWIDETGKIGIGTASPTGLLTVNGTNPWIEMQNNGVDKGFLQATGNDLKLGTNSTNTTGNLVFQTKLIDRMMIDENGQIGIGTSTPGSALTLNGSNPILQIRNADIDKGFIQLVNDDIKIGTNIGNANGNFIVRTNGSDRFSVTGTGNVGIGTSTPIYKLDVNGTSRFTGNQTITGNQNVTGLITGGDMEINSSTPSIELNSSLNGTYGKFEIDNSNNVVLGKGFYGGALVLDGAIGQSAKRLYINKANHFNFGTGLSPANHTVSVEGGLIATFFTEASINNWPDYVFEDGYRLKPLTDVKAFIAANKHLPNIPPASEIEKHGLQLGDMSKRLMEKVEELTLYIINLQEQIDALKKNK
jgi:hypothetical protein